MKVNSEQIDQLFVFTRQHFVEWYDLQLELVDHLANAIEQKWQENPKLSFDEALQSEFKKFGIFGFQDVIEKKQKAMTKIYNRFIWQNFKDFFTISNTIVAFSIGILLFWLFSLPNFNPILILVLSFPVCVVLIYKSYKLGKLLKSKQIKSNKKWLLEDMVYNFGGWAGIFSLIFQLTCRIDNLENILVRVFVSTAIVVSFVFFYIISFKIPAKAQAFLKSTYPEYKFEKSGI